MKKAIFKRFFITALFLCIVLSFSFSVSAATYTTTTRYLTTSEIQVTSTATDVEQGEYVTYYVEDTEGNVVYLDQKTVEAGEDEVVFRYKTSSSNISAEMKFGGTADIASCKGDDDFVEQGYVISISINGNVVKSVIVPEQEEGLVLSRKFDITDLNLGKIKEVKFNDEVVEDIAVSANSIVTYTDQITSDGTLDITCEPFDSMKIKYGTLTYDKGILSVLSKVTAEDFCEYGIILSDKSVMDVNDVAESINPSELSGNLASGNVVKFKAIGKGSNGNYGLELQGINNYLSAGTYYVAAYVTDGNNTLVNATTMLGTSSFVIE